MKRSELAAELERRLRALSAGEDIGSITAEMHQVGALVCSYPQEILTALRAPSPEPTAEEVERAAKQYATEIGAPWELLFPAEQDRVRESVVEILRAARSRP